MPVKQTGSTTSKNTTAAPKASNAPAATQERLLFPAKLSSINETAQKLWTNASGVDKMGYMATIEFQVGDEIVTQSARVYDTTMAKTDFAIGDSYSVLAEEYNGNLYFTIIGAARPDRLSADQIGKIVGIKTVQLRATPRVRQAAPEVKAA